MKGLFCMKLFINLKRLTNGLAFMGQKIWCWLLPMDSKQTDHKVSVVKIYRSTPIKLI